MKEEFSMNKFDSLCEGFLSAIKDVVFPKEPEPLPIDYKKMKALEVEAFNLKEKADEKVKPLLDVLEKAAFVWGTGLIYHNTVMKNKLSMFPDFFKVLSQVPHIKSTLKVTEAALNKLKSTKGYEQFCSVMANELKRMKSIVANADPK